MKSAYELAMERFERENPGGSRTLSPEQKEKMAEVRKKFEAKIAEKEVFLKQQMEEARGKGDSSALEQLERQLIDERTRLREECEVEVDRVRSDGAG